MVPERGTAGAATMSRAGAEVGGGGSGRRAALAGVVAGAVAGLAAGLAWPAPRAAGIQPIAFDHRLHAGEQQIACATCHAFEAPEPFSGFPGIDVCAACHSEPQGKSAEEAKIVRAVQAGTALVWTPLWREPWHVFFSHRLHAGAAAIACERCHGGIGDARAPPARVRPVRMGDCLGCHAGARAPTRCTACHR